MRKTRFCTALLVVAAILFMNFTPLTLVRAEVSSNTIDFAFSDAVCASAMGTITLSSFDADGDCSLYWGDKNGILQEYQPLAKVKVLPDTVSQYSPYNKTVIPYNASYLYGLVDDETVFTYAIPKEKQFSTDVYGEKRYSFGQLSDIHIQAPAGNPGSKFTNALDFFKDNSVSLVAISGDIALNNVEQEYIDYKNHVTPYEQYFPIYIASGNHDSAGDIKLNWWKKYTNKGELFFEVEQGDDVFLFMGLQTWDDFTAPFTDAEMAWLEEKLEQYKDRRVFLEMHLFLQHTTGTLYKPGTLQSIYPEGNLFKTYSAQENQFRALMKKYKNVIHFNGHSHWKYNLQKFNPDLNVYDTNGTSATFVHVSGCSTPIKLEDFKRVTDDNASEGYLVDVYQDAVILKAVDFMTGQFISEANYLIDTTPKPSNDAYIPALKGEGTKASPYLIQNAQDFASFTQDIITGYEFHGKYFRQTADIDMTSIPGYEGIRDIVQFGGIYDGDGHTIHVDITAGKPGNVSVFPSVTGVVMNLGTTGRIVSEFTDAQVSGIAALNHNTGALMNVYSTVSLQAPYMAGICYTNWGDIFGSYFAGTTDNPTGAKYAICSTEGTNNGAAYSYYLAGSAKTAYKTIRPVSIDELCSAEFLSDMNFDVGNLGYLDDRIAISDLNIWTTGALGLPVLSQVKADGASYPGDGEPETAVYDDFTTFNSAPKHYAINGLGYTKFQYPKKTRYGLLGQAISPRSGIQNGFIMYEGDFSEKQLNCLVTFDDSFINNTVAPAYPDVDRWAAYEEAIATAGYKVYAGSDEDTLTEIEPMGYTFTKPGSGMALTAEIIVNLPADTQFVKVEVAGAYSTARIARISIADCDGTLPIRYTYTNALLPEPDAVMDVSTITDNEIFRFVETPDGVYSIQQVATGNYLSAEDGMGLTDKPAPIYLTKRSGKFWMQNVNTDKCIHYFPDTVSFGWGTASYIYLYQKGTSGSRTTYTAVSEVDPNAEYVLVSERDGLYYVLTSKKNGVTGTKKGLVALEIPVDGDRLVTGDMIDGIKDVAISMGRIQSVAVTNNSNSDAKLLVAFYGDAGGAKKLVSFNMLDVSSGDYQDGYVEIPLNLSIPGEAISVKVMLWDSAQTVQPVVDMWNLGLFQ